IWATAGRPRPRPPCTRPPGGGAATPPAGRRSRRPRRAPARGGAGGGGPRAPPRARGSAGGGGRPRGRPPPGGGPPRPPRAPQPIETVEAMVNLDMVGRLREDKLQVMGVGTATEFPALAAAVNAAVPDAHFDLKTSEDGYGPSDHQSFYKKNVPVLMLFTGA